MAILLMLLTQLLLVDMAILQILLTQLSDEEKIILLALIDRLLSDDLEMVRMQHIHLLGGE